MFEMAGGRTGAIGIDPAAPDPRVISPSTIITELSVNGATLAHEDQPIAPGRRDLVVRYSAPTFERADELRFRYRLDGVDPDWIDAGTRRVASYADLGPGRHRRQSE